MADEPPSDCPPRGDMPGCPACELEPHDMHAPPAVEPPSDSRPDWERFGLVCIECGCTSGTPGGYGVCECECHVGAANDPGNPLRD